MIKYIPINLEKHLENKTMNELMIRFTDHELKNGIRAIDLLKDFADTLGLEFYQNQRSPDSN